MINVSRLLKKKSWTGSELGRLQIADTLKVFEKTKSGSKKELISREDFRKMLDSLDDQKERQIYNGYIAIHEWFRMSYASALAEEQAAHLNFIEMDHAISNALIAEDIYETFLKMPDIMTKEEYTPYIRELHTYMNQISLEGYFDNEENKDNIEYIKTSKKRLLKSYYYLKGWNEALDLIAAEFDIEEILVAQINIQNLDEKLTRYNQKVTLFSEKIKNSDGTNKELKENKMKVLKKVLSPVPFENIKIPEEKIEEAKKQIIDFSAFKDINKDIRIVLCHAS